MADPSVTHVPRFGQRHVVALLANIGLLIMSGLRSTLSVALVAMVNESSVLIINGTSPDNSCPAPSHRKFSHTYSEKFDWSRQLQGIILSAFFWGYLPLQLPAAFWSKRFSAKWLFTGGVIFTALISFLTPTAARLHPYCFVALRVIVGLCEGIAFPSITTLLSRWIPHSEVSFFVAFALSGVQLGVILGQLLAGALCASLYGWPSSFYVAAAFAFLWLPFWALLASDHPADQRYISAEEALWIEKSAATGRHFDTSIRSLPWSQILKDKAVWAFSFCMMVNSWKFFMFLTCLPQFLSDVLHFDIRSNGLVTALPFLGNFFMQFVAGALADWTIQSGRLSRTATRKLFTAIGLGGVAIFIVVATVTGCNATATIAMLVLMLSFSAFSLGGFIPNSFDLSPEYCSVLYAFANTLGIAAGIVAPIVVDRMTWRHSRGQWTAVFFLTAAIVTSGALVFVLFGSAEQRSWGEEEPLTEEKEMSKEDLSEENESRRKEE